MNIINNSKEDSFAFYSCLTIYSLLILGFYISPLFFILAFFLADLSLTSDENKFYDKQYLHLMRTAGYWIIWVIIGFGLLVLDIGFANHFDYSAFLKGTELDKLFNYHPIESFLTNNTEIESDIHKYIYQVFGFSGTSESIPDLINFKVLNNLWFIDYKQAFITSTEAGNHIAILITTFLMVYVFVVKCLFNPIYEITYGLISLLTKQEV